MAIRRVQPSDRDLLRGMWDAERTRAEFAREQGWTLEMAASLLANPRALWLIDPAPDAQSMGLWFRHAADVELSLVFSRASTATRRFRAANRMIAHGCRLLQAEGYTRGWGTYTFSTASNAIISYWQGLLSCTVTITPALDGFMVRVTADIAPLCAELEARG